MPSDSESRFADLAFAKVSLEITRPTLHKFLHSHPAALGPIAVIEGATRREGAAVAIKRSVSRLNNTERRL